MKKLLLRRKTTSIVIGTMMFAFVVLGLIWYASGDFLPLGISSPERSNTDNPAIAQKLEREFPNTSERAINSIMARCDRANWIDWSNHVYPRFIEKFENEETLNQHQANNSCP